MNNRVTTIIASFIAAITITLSASPSHASNNDKNSALLKAGEQRLDDNQTAQQTVDNLADANQSLLRTYMEELKLLKSLQLYNDMLDRQLADQSNKISTLNKSINNATLIERQILPLLVRMVDALEQFVALDVPFLAKERQARIAHLKKLLEKSELTTSEKARRVFEAYQIESEYGSTIESYQGNVTLPDRQFAVEFLRVGRISLMYRDLSASEYGVWDHNAKQWQPLTDSQYKRHINKGVKIAKEEMAPELITIPLLVNMEQR